MAKSSTAPVAKVSVIYRAPEGDNKVCEMFGHTFFDGKAVEIEDTPENHDAIVKLGKNKLFELSEEGKASEVRTEPDKAHRR